MQPIHTPVVHPVDSVSLIAAVEAAKERLIVPLFLGPERKNQELPIWSTSI